MTNTPEQADMTDTPTTHPLSPRLRELSDAVTQGREAVAREFTMRVPAEPNRDAEIARLREEVTAGESSLGYAMDTVHKADAEIARLRAEVEALREDLRYAEAALSDIGDADREPGDDLAWCERRAAKALPRVRAAIDAARTPEGRSDG